MRKFSLFVLVLLVFAIFPASAQENGFAVYLFSSDARALLRVGQDGTEHLYSLGVEADGQFINGDVSISPDGRLVAFCVIDTVATPQAYTLIIRDIVAEINITERKDGDAGGCRVGAFSADGTQVALGQVFADASGNAFPSGGSALFWRLALVDVLSGEVVQALSRDSANAPTVIFNGLTVAILPDAGDLAGNMVYFRALPYVGAEFLDVDGYMWDVETGSVTPFPEYGIYNSDFSVLTGEVIYPSLDESRPNAQAFGIIPPSNRVLTKSTVDGSAQEVYFNGEWSISRARFINEGSRFLVNLLPSIENSSPDVIGERIAIVERDGASSEINIPGIHSSFGSTAQTLVVSWLESQEAAPFITHLATLEEGQLREFYQRQDMGNFPQYWQIVAVVGN